MYILWTKSVLHYWLWNKPLGTGTFLALPQAEGTGVFLFVLCIFPTAGIWSMKIGQSMIAGMWAFFQIQEIGSIIVISAHAQYSVMLTKMQILNPGSRGNMLQGPDPFYGCGQFYPCRWFYWNKGNFSSDAVSSSWRCAFWIWALKYYLKHVVTHLLVVGNTLLCVDSHWLQGVCSQCQDPLRSQNPASGTTYINSAKNSLWALFGESPVHLCGWWPSLCLVLLPSCSWCRREKIHQLFLWGYTNHEELWHSISHKLLCALLPPLRVADFGVPISVSPCPLWALVK